jgi:hypothetical protein
VGVLVNLACFLGALGAACAFFAAILPFPDVPGIRQKLDWLAAQGDDFDVVFLGSSRVEQQIIPSVFDETAAALGHPVRSFNAGMPAMVPPEDSYVLEQILARPHRRLRWVFVEVMPFGGQFDAALAGTGRMDYWHDAARMGLLTKRTLVDLRRAWGERISHRQTWFGQCVHLLAVWWSHVESCGTRGLNYGRGAVLLSWRLHGKKASHYDGGGPGGDGWLPAEPHFMQGELLAGYERQFAALRENPPSRYEEALSEDSLRDKVDLLRRHGVEPILFLPPTLANSQFYPSATLTSAPFFDLSDMNRYPNLYAAKNHKDGVHLNVAGAEIFTRELAARFVEQVRSPAR